MCRQGWTVNPDGGGALVCGGRKDAVVVFEVCTIDGVYGRRVKAGSQDEFSDGVDISSLGRKHLFVLSIGVESLSRLDFSLSGLCREGNALLNEEVTI